MTGASKKRLYLHELMEDPVVAYPAWYPLSPALYRDEGLREALRALHGCDLGGWRHPDSVHSLLDAMACGIYPIYRERHVAALFGQRVMMLQRQGWKTLPLGRESVDTQQWLLP